MMTQLRSLSYVLLTYAVLFGTTLQLHAQELQVPSTLPPSPNAAELGRYGDIPVGHSTGALNLSIPLASLSTRNLTVPISLTYSSNGFRVNAIGSRAGFDWVLNSGGVITRMVFDEPDKGPGVQPVLTEPDFQTHDMALYDFLQQCNTPGWDNQPDIFNFNFGDYTGSFMFDKYGNVYQIPHSPLKIEYVGGAPYNGFIITSPDGVKYHFGGETATELSNYLPESSCTVYEGLEIPTATAWYLKRIEHPMGDYIDFAYAPLSVEYRSSVTQTFYDNDLARVQCTEPNLDCPEYPDQICSTYLWADVVRLTGITASTGETIAFSYKLRQDMNGDGLHDEIIFYNTQAQRYKKFKLEHLQVTSQEFSAENADEMERHFLTAVKEFGSTDSNPILHQFSYNELSSLPKRFSTSQDMFGYFNGKQSSYHVQKPAELLVQERFFKNGGYIGADKSPDATYAKVGLLNKVVYPTGGFSDISYEGHDSYITEEIQGPPELKVITVEGDDNEPTVVEELPAFIAPSDQPALRRAVFAKFVNSTGVVDQDHHIRLTVILMNNTTGLPVLENYVSIGEERYFDVGLVAGESYTLRVEFYGFTGHSGIVNMKVYPAPQTITHNKQIGGVRVEKVSSYEQQGAVPVVKKYVYRYINDLTKSSGKLVAEPDHHVTTLHSGVAYAPTTPGDLAVYTCDCDYVILSGTSGGATSRFFAPYHISYQSVLESHGENFENGGIEYVYNIQSDVGGSTELNGPMFNTPLTNAGYSNGALKMKNVFRWNGSSAIYTTTSENFYKVDPRITATLKALVVRKNFSIQGTSYVIVPATRAFIGAFDVESYLLYSRWNYLEKTIEKNYDALGNETLSNTTNYYYDNTNHALINRIETTDSRGNAVVQTRKYPQDVTASGTEEIARLGLIGSKQVGAIIEESVSNNGVLRNSRQVFKEFLAGKFLPEKTLTNTATGNQMEPRIIFNRYDQRGNILELNRANDQPTSFVWGYKYSFPVAQVTNANYQQIINVLGQTVLNELNDNPGSDQQVRQKLQPLFTHPSLSNCQVLVYTYDPVVGVTSITDANNITTRYEYDTFNRLRFTKDNDLNILQRFSYHHKASPTDVNFVKTEVTMQPGLTTDGSVSAATINQKTVTNNYLDGLGRPLQTVIERGSPGYNDIVQPLAYDKHGREQYKYLPFVSGNDGAYKNNNSIIDALTNEYIGVAQGFYAPGSNNKVADDSKPYARTIFEPTPLNRISKVGSAGAAFQPNENLAEMNDKSIKKKYETNVQSEVLLINYDDNTGMINISTNISERYYQANQLMANRIFDQHNNETVEFTDKEGKLICKKVQYDMVGGVKLFAETYYIYNAYGKLAMVLPPEAVVRVASQ